MKQFPKYPRILGIAPTARGFGFAVLEGLDTLANWGVKAAKGNKNAQSLRKVENLFVQYSPDVVVLEDTSVKNSRRAPRIRRLHRLIASLAKRHALRIAVFTQEHVKFSIFPEGAGTKHEIAEIIADKFPDELATRLPPKRRPWMSEDSRMSIFDAMALILAFRKKNTNRSI